MPAIYPESIGSVEGLIRKLSRTPKGGPTDSVAPVLSVPTAAALGVSTASGTVTTDDATGTLFAVTSMYSTAPTANQIIAGLNALGTPATWAGSQAVEASGVQTLDPVTSGLESYADYYTFYVHMDSAGNKSNVVGSAKFTTSLAPTPVIQATSGAGSSTEVTSQAITMPTGVTVGDLLVVVYGTGNGTTNISSGTGWRKSNQFRSVAPSLSVFYKYATGDDALTVSQSVNYTNAYTVYRISGAKGPPTVHMGATTGATINMNSGRVTTESQNMLWLSAIVHSAPETVNINAVPASYTDLIAFDSTYANTNVGLGTVRRNNAVDVESGGSFTLSASQNAAVARIGIGPKTPNRPYLVQRTSFAVGGSLVNTTRVMDNTQSSQSDATATAGKYSVDCAMLPGDVLIACYLTGSNTNRSPSIVTDGYTSLGDLYADGTSYDTNATLFYKQMGATPDTEIVFSGTGAAEDGGVLVTTVWRNMDPSSISVTTATGTGTNCVNPAAITPTHPKSVVAVYGGGASLTGNALQAVSDFEIPYLNYASDTYDVTGGFGGFLRWTSGEINPAAWGPGSSLAANSWAGFTLALKPVYPE